MHRAARKCETCPFRSPPEGYAKSTAHIVADGWPCHTIEYYDDDGSVQCRGHWQAVRKFGAFIGPVASDFDLSDRGRKEWAEIEEITEGAVR